MVKQIKETETEKKNEKEEWIESWTTGRFAEADKDVITFIADILFHGDSGVIYNLFACGYCYYFACMLKEAFGRGTVCWHKGFSHVVWVDEDDIAYDIGGIFMDYEKGGLVPIEELGEQVIQFKHTPLRNR